MSARKYFSPPLFACLLAIVVALGFALYTNHTWEDYYITYRSSKNLATGQGLVFSVGERLHTFTSPLGVLLPAVAYGLTGNTSDVGALWIFRVMCAGSLGGTVWLLMRLLAREPRARLLGGVLAAWLITDPKIIDFTINGMETAFMLLFLAYALWGQLTPGPRQARHLGLAWAGLMWTRPDSFVYIGLLALGGGLFRDAADSKQSRWALLQTYLRAGLITTVIYVPWLAWATWYYGTPIPHTITAKGGISQAHTLSGLLTTAWQLPWLAWAKSSSLELTFLPSYALIGGWPSGLLWFSRSLATLAALAWLVPVLRPWARIASFTFFGAHVYLTYFPYFPFPWYIPATTLFACVSLAGIFYWLAGGPRRRLLAGVLAAGLIITNGWMLGAVARQVRAQQIHIEEGTRRKIGEWLHTQARPGDTVFLEPLGYIGFYSGLKTYDFPGMSSREMVAARREVSASWGALIQYLAPTWIVLRPFEIDRVNREAPDLLAEDYELVRTFDQSAVVASLRVHGRPYLEHDAHFSVWHRRVAIGPVITLNLAGAQLPASHLQVADKAYRIAYNGHRVSVIGAPARVEFPLAPDATELTGGFGLLNDEWFLRQDPRPVDFRISLRQPDGAEKELWRQRLDPVTRPADRGFLIFRLPLPKLSGGTLCFTTTPTVADARVPRAFWGEFSVDKLQASVMTPQGAIPLSATSEAQFGLANTVEDGLPCLLAHAPAALDYVWPETLRLLEADFGIMRGAHTNDKTTDGVVFTVEWQDAQGRRQTLFRRYLDPMRNEHDRGVQRLAIAIPATPGGRVILRTAAAPSGQLTNAWSYWGNLQAR